MIFKTIEIHGIWPNEVFPTDNCMHKNKMHIVY